MQKSQFHSHHLRIIYRVLIHMQVLHTYQNPVTNSTNLNWLYSRNFSPYSYLSSRCFPMFPWAHRQAMGKQRQTHIPKYSALQRKPRQNNFLLEKKLVIFFHIFYQAWKKCREIWANTIGVKFFVPIFHIFLTDRGLVLNEISLSRYDFSGTQPSWKLNLHAF